MIRHAYLSLLPNVAHRVGVRSTILVRHQNTGDVLVEVVVGKDHTIIYGGIGAGTVDLAVEEVVLGRAEGGFDVVVELGDDIGDFAEIGVVVLGSSVSC